MSSSPPVSTEGPRGYLDEVSDSGVASGWAFDSAAPDKSLTVELCLDGEPALSTIADLFRVDLASKNMGTGRHGFSADLSRLLVEDRPYAISARTTGVELKNVVTVRGGPALANKRRTVHEPGRFLHVEHEPALVARLARSRRRLAIVAYYQAQGRVFDYHRRILQDLKNQGFATVLVRNGAENLAGFLDHARGLADLVVVRENSGFDFSAWLSVVELLRDTMEELDELVFANDSVIGPLFPLREAVARMAAAECDFWGMTDSWGRAYHLQSYFLCFKQRALRSSALRDYLRSYRHPLDKSEVIDQGEVGLTQALLGAGLRPAAYCPYLDVAQRWLNDLPRRLAEAAHSPEAATNPSPGQPLQQYLSERATHYALAARSLRSGEALNSPHYFWDTLIRDFRLPFVKKDLLLRNPESVPDTGNIRTLLASHTEFPVESLLEVFALTPGALAPPLPLVVA